MWTRCAARSAQLSPRRAICHHARLNLSPGASSAAIKAAFVQNAKKCHPDVTNGDIATAQRDFVALKAAYDVLSNPKSRALYLQSLSRRGAEEAAAAAAHVASHHPHSNTDYDSGNFRHKKRRGIKDVVASTQSSYQEFQRELEAALDAAYSGPIFESNSVADIPEAFELEEIVSLPEEFVGSVCLQQLVCGRQLLGEVHWLNNVDSADATTTTTLQLRMGSTGETVARAIRNEPLGIIRFERRRSGGVGEWLHEATLNEARAVLLDASNVETHKVLRTYTPGVHTVTLYSRRGFVEFKGTKAWLLPSSVWWWPPRDERFGTEGGWYWETNRSGRYSTRRAKSLGGWSGWVDSELHEQAVEWRKHRAGACLWHVVSSKEAGSRRHAGCSCTRLGGEWQHHGPGAAKAGY